MSWTLEKIKQASLCLIDPSRQCTDFCKKWISTKCNGAYLIRQGSTDEYMPRSSFNLEEKIPKEAES